MQLEREKEKKLIKLPRFEMRNECSLGSKNVRNKVPAPVPNDLER